MLATQTNGLITGGLGLPANSGLITMAFTLFVKSDYVPPKPPVTSGGGGGHVPVRQGRAARGHAVQMRHTPVAPARTGIAHPYTPAQRSGAPLRIITVKTSFGDVFTTKEYVADKKIVVKVKVNQLFVQLRETINIVAEGLFSEINKE